MIENVTEEDVKVDDEEFEKVEISNHFDFH